MYENVCIKDIKNGAVDFNQFLLWKVNQFINKVNITFIEYVTNNEM